MKDIDKGVFKKLKRMKKMSLEVGVFADAKNPDAAGTAYVAEYARYNEYGAKVGQKGEIPRRSFLRSTEKDQKKKWAQYLADIVNDVIATDGDVNIETELYKVGDIARKDIINKIDSNIQPKNAESTRFKKHKKGKKQKTLIDTGALRQSIEARIKNV